MLKVGDRAPDINAPASDGTHFVLSAQQGLCTVIYFFPKAFTPGCTAETKRFRDNHAEIALAGAGLVGISTDDLSRQCAFADSLKAPFPMIGDADHSIARAYGVLWPLIGVARRVTFVVGPDMRVEAVFRHEVRIAKHRDDVLAFIDKRFRSTRAPESQQSPSSRRLGTPSRAVPAGRAPVGAEALLAKAPPSAAAPSRGDAEARGRSAPPGRPRSVLPGRGGVVADRFELSRRAASGASGDIYQARDRATGAAVAVKLLRQGPARDDARFEREARILADLRHPAIVAYVAHGIEPDGEAYLVTEWLEGESLSKRLSRGPLSVAETLTLGVRVATALGVAHARGVVHRDIKPGNLFLPGAQIDQVKLLDFGVSRPTTVVSQLTAPGDMIGTPGYMAPEQARGKDTVDSRADVFSLGCVLFKCLTGRAAFTGEDMVALLVGVLKQEIPPVRELNPEVPAPVSALVGRMLSKPVEGRPADGHAVAAELAAIHAAKG